MAGNIVRIKNYWYNDIDSLGAGSFGAVFKGHDDENKELHVAIKRIQKGELPPDIVEREIKILQGLSKIKNAHIVSLISALENMQYVYLVMEFCNGGDLHHYLEEKKNMDERRLSTFLQQIASAMKILYDNDIIHRDLKPANILLTHEDRHNITFKIADFGLGRFLDEDYKAKTVCGTEGYMAPEMLKPGRKYDYKVDLYSIGAIVHQCFTGDPFSQPPQKFPSNMSHELRDLLSRLLRKDPKERINFDDFYNHPFIKPTRAEAIENCTFVIGLNDGSTVTNDVVKINLCRPHEISSEVEIPTIMQIDAVAAVYCDTIYVVGIGARYDEIWKYSMTYGWLKCASLVQGRRRHCAAFVDQVLYVFGGIVDSDKRVLDSVEVYNSVNNKCVTVGKLVQWVDSSSTCFPFNSSIYFFGGKDADDKKRYQVQVYNTKEHRFSVLSTPMPRSQSFMRAVLWETSVILLGSRTCFIFNFETETWQERQQFNTGVVHFGLANQDERIFVIGGCINETDKDGKIILKFRDDVRYVPVQNIFNDEPIAWKIHATLPKPSLVQAFANCTFYSSK